MTEGVFVGSEPRVLDLDPALLTIAGDDRVGFVEADLTDPDVWTSPSDTLLPALS